VERLKPADAPAARLALAFLAGSAAALVAIGSVVVLVVGSGLYDVSATRPHGRLTSWVTHQVFLRSVKLRAKTVDAPASFTEAQVLAGFRVYRADCEPCHGGPGTPRAFWVSSLTPTPPYLLDVSRKLTPAQLYWTIDNGVKMTAMPRWGSAYSKRQIWNIVAFLEALPRITPASIRRWRPGRTARRRRRSKRRARA
jgi:mono/diheme cytochrome c family protein